MSVAVFAFSINNPSSGFSTYLSIFSGVTSFSSAIFLLNAFSDALVVAEFNFDSLSCVLAA